MKEILSLLNRSDRRTGVSVTWLSGPLTHTHTHTPAVFRNRKLLTQCTHCLLISVSNSSVQHHIACEWWLFCILNSMDNMYIKHVRNRFQKLKHKYRLYEYCFILLWDTFSRLILCLIFAQFSHSRSASSMQNHFKSIFFKTMHSSFKH